MVNLLKTFYLLAHSEQNLFYSNFFKIDFFNGFDKYHPKQEKPQLHNYPLDLYCRVQENKHRLDLVRIVWQWLHQHFGMAFVTQNHEKHCAETTSCEDYLTMTSPMFWDGLCNPKHHAETSLWLLLFMILGEKLTPDFHNTQLWLVFEWHKTCIIGCWPYQKIKP